MFKRGYQRHHPSFNVKPMSQERVERVLKGDALRNPIAPLSAGAIEAKALMEKAKSLLKGESTMPDFNTALRSAIEKKSQEEKREQLRDTLDAWDKDDQQATQPKEAMKNRGNNFAVTNNVTRETFNFVKANPGLINAEITNKMVKLGFKSSSVQSLVGQMCTVGLFKRDDKRRIYAAADVFKPFNINAARRKIKQAAAEAPKRKVVMIERRKREEAPAGLAALNVQPVQVDGKTIGSFKQHGAWQPEDVVNVLNVMQARQLYDYLKNVFGG